MFGAIMEGREACGWGSLFSEEEGVVTLGVVTSKHPFLGLSGLMETLIFSALRAVSSFAARVLNAPQLLLWRLCWLVWVGGQYGSGSIHSTPPKRMWGIAFPHPALHMFKSSSVTNCTPRGRHGSWQFHGLPISADDPPPLVLKAWSQHPLRGSTDRLQALTLAYQASMTTESPPVLEATATCFSTTSAGLFLVIPPFTDPFFGGISRSSHCL